MILNKVLWNEIKIYDFEDMERYIPKSLIILFYIYIIYLAILFNFFIYEFDLH